MENPKMVKNGPFDKNQGFGFIGGRTRVTFSPLLRISPTTKWGIKTPNHVPVQRGENESSYKYLSCVISPT